MFIRSARRNVDATKSAGVAKQDVRKSAFRGAAQDAVERKKPKRDLVTAWPAPTRTPPNTAAGDKFRAHSTLDAPRESRLANFLRGQRSRSLSQGP